MRTPAAPKRLWAVLLLALLLAAVSFAETRMAMQFSEPTRFLVAHGRRAWAGGYANGGLEVWAGALQIASDVRPEFRRTGDVTAIPGSQIVSKIDVDLTHIARTYTGPDFSVTEEVWVPLDQPAALIQYTVRSTRPVQVIVRFRPSLNLMWPAAIGGQEISWNEMQPGYRLTDAARQFAAVVLAPGATAHDEPLNSARALPQTDELAVVLDERSPKILFAEVDPSRWTQPMSETQLTVVRRLLESSAWQHESRKHYDEVLSSGLQIDTPSDEVDRALAWAKVALDQAWFCNSDLGCGYVAGFGPSRRNRRPQYAWYFAGDGIIDAQAAMAVGDLERAREELHFIAKFQDLQTGMIWHELTQSAPYIDWRGKYSYMFGHANLTSPYISAVAEYVRGSNDRAFMQEKWESVRKAFAYSRSLISTDGLPRIPAGKEGLDEQNELSDELGLSASWVVACSDYAHLAELMGQGEAAREARELADKARASFTTRYWDAKRSFAIHGYLRKGEPMKDRGIVAIAAIPQRLFSDAQRAQILDAIASSQFQSDWGTRSVGMGEAGFDPTGYAHGSVWALSTADVAQAYWKEHRPEIAWGVWRTLVSWSSLDSPGHMHEVLAGDTYHPQVESVPEQTWSSAALLSAAVRGLFGLDIDAESGIFTFAPHLPADWDRVALRGARMGDAKLNLVLEQGMGGIKLRVENAGENIHMRFRPRIPLGAQVLTATVGGRKVAVRTETHAQDQHAVLEFAVPHGIFEISIGYRNGLGVVLPETRPSLGEPSTGLKLTSVALVANVLHLDLDVMPGTENSLQIRTERTVRGATHAAIKKLSSHIYEMTIKPEATKGADYQRQHVTVSFAD